MNGYIVEWATPGTKTLSFNGVSQTILVTEAPKGDFVIPAKIGKGEIRVALCENATDGVWTLIDADSEEPVDLSKWSVKPDNNGSAEICINEIGKYTLSHVVSDPVGDFSYSHPLTVTSLPTPELGLVTIDNATGYYAVSVAEPNSFNSVNIYKETDVADNYILLASGISCGDRFIDSSSAPEMKASRYVVRGCYPDGGESAMSKAHQPVHLMISVSASKGWNLFWSRYEGLDIESYNIMRGTSPENLSLVTTVSGNMASYLDSNAPSGVLYYAVEPVVKDVSRAASGKSNRSNTVSTEDAIRAVLAEEINVVSLNGDKFLDSENGTQLCAYLTPANATVRSVNWTIEQGSEFATIDSRGLITHSNPAVGGYIVARATAVDGSGVYGEFPIIALAQSDVELPETDRTSSDKLFCYPNPVVDQTTTTVKGLGEEGAELTIFNISGVACRSIQTSTDTETISIGDLHTGHYILKAVRSNDGSIATGKIIVI